MNWTTEALLQQVEWICAQRDAALKRVVELEAQLIERHTGRRINIERTDDGYRICEGSHNSSDPCEWGEYVPKTAPKPETDWSAVKRGTRVTCWDGVRINPWRGIYLGYNAKASYPHGMMADNSYNILSWQHCELVEEGDE